MTRRTRFARAVAAVLATGALLLSGCGPTEKPVTVGLITKQEENPYWVTMRQQAKYAADEQDAKLVTATGSSDVDVQGQIKAMRDMIAQKVDGILIAPTSSTKLNPVIKEARDAGIVVIALDTPVKPLSTVDAYFATDNAEAGRLAGQYAAAKAKQLGLKPQVATLDLARGIASGEDRHAGFLKGFGLKKGSAQLVDSQDTQGDRELGESAMAKVLGAHPGVNVVYTVNEPATLGALTALKAANRDEDGVVLVSVDGGCEAVKGPVRSGQIDATVQQFPQNMATEGVKAVAKSVREGVKPSGYLNTCVQLISDSPAPGVASRDVAFGVRNCWGD